MIVLDTHALLGWVSGNKDRLSITAAAAIEAEMDGGRIFVSSISAWELAMLRVSTIIDGPVFRLFDGTGSTEE